METILLKLSGELFSKEILYEQKAAIIKDIVNQIKELKKECNIGIVVGAGNLFRGSQQGNDMNIDLRAAHTIGMLSTITNGLILQDFLKKEKVESVLFSAINCPEVAHIIRQSKINKSLQKNQILIFTGGTGNPFFTTDTNAVLRSLQINANELWKATKVDGVYDADPIKNKDAKKIETISYKEVIEKKLQVMDLTAITLAEENRVKIRVFNLFEKDALIKANKDSSFGSYIG